MSETEQRTCEVKVDGTWRLVTILEARSLYRARLTRCPACYGQVNVVGTYVGAGRLGLQHRKAHTGCSFSLKDFVGTPSPHPQALT